MAYELNLRVKNAYKHEAKHFLEFLKAVGRKYPVNFSYRNSRHGRFHVAFDQQTVARVGALLQELVLNRGLNYYFLSLKPGTRIRILNEVILPISQTLVESCFRVPYSRFLRRHVLGRIPQGSFVPGEVGEETAHEFEVLFRRWDIGITDDWNFVKDADAILTKFLLQQISHVPGTKSPNFPLLLAQANVTGIGWHREVRKTMGQIHDARAGGLHRLQASFTHEQLKPMATRLYLYFEYFDVFSFSQLIESVRVHRRDYKRIRYGEETWLKKAVPGIRSEDFAKRPCHDCFALKGQYHCEGCDVEECPKCGGQLLTCGRVDVPY